MESKTIVTRVLKASPKDREIGNPGNAANKVTPTNKKSTKQRSFFGDTENIVGGIILIATISIYHILLFVVHAFSEREGILGFIGVNFLEVLLIPGIISTLLFYLYSKKLKKAFVIGVITSIVWIFWLILFTYTMVRVII